MTSSGSFFVGISMFAVAPPRAMAPPHAPTRVVLMSEPGRELRRKRNIVLVCLALSFVPYALPVEERPRLYRDGMTQEQIREQQTAIRINRFLGARIQDLPSF